MTESTFFSRVHKPGRYLGSEYHSTTKNWEQAELRCGLIFPDLYEIGMSHQGLQILYHILNRRDNYLAERCYCPDRDVEQLLRAENRPLSALESGRPLGEFDLLGITLPYELCYTNILTVLDLAGIPALAADRGDRYPLLIGGGACSMNPEPVADFFDAVLLGDGEEAILEVAEVVLRAKKENRPRAALLSDLSTIRGVYIPSYFKPHYDNKGRISRIEPLQPGMDNVVRRILPNLDAIDHLLHPLVPNARIVHDRLGVEIARGCTRGCRFCQAGMTYRPVRERTPEQVLELARRGIGSSGFEELALQSLSTGDYSCLGEVLPQLMDTFADEYVSVAMPSMRVGTLTPEIMDQIRRVRKTGFTLAPEAGSEKLRRVINKGITEEDLLAATRAAYSLGWEVMKLYFMIGLPTETEQDISDIVDLVKKIQQEGEGTAGRKKKINVSVGTFVPKPHTPFQWAGQLSIESSRERLNWLRQNLPRKGCTMKWHKPERSYLEGVFSRGDRRLARLIMEAWQAGARLDGWTEHFNLDLWRSAASTLKLDLDDYLRARETDEPLPWQHLHTGIDMEFMLQELENAESEVYTPDCRYHGCQLCGLCDFDTIQPIVHSSVEPGTGAGSPIPPGPAAEKSGKRAIPAHDENHIKYMVGYSRTGNVCYLGHLEILQLIFRGLRRAGITTNFSKGFNPTPKVSFGPALPVGTRSMAEFFIMDLPEPLTSCSEAAARLSSSLPEGMEVFDIQLHSGKMPQTIATSYRIRLPRGLTEKDAGRLREFMTSNELLVTRRRKDGRPKQFNIRPLFTELGDEDGNTVLMTVISKSGSPGIKPADALQAILELEEREVLEAIITKTAWKGVDDR